MHLKAEIVKLENSNLMEMITFQKQQNQRLHEELQDIRLSRDELLAKNADLEKKQRK